MKVLAYAVVVFLALVTCVSVLYNTALSSSSSSSSCESSSSSPVGAGTSSTKTRAAVTEGSLEDHQWKLFRDLSAKSIRNEPFQKRSRGYCNKTEWQPWERKNCLGNTGASMLYVVHLQELMDLLVSEIFVKGIKGDIVECGVWQGGGSIAMGLTRDYWKEDAMRTLWLFDSFAGHPEYTDKKDFDMMAYKGSLSKFLAVALETVQENLRAFHVLENVKYVKGYFDDTMPKRKDEIESIAVLRMDADAYTSTTTILDNLYHKVSIGGLVIVDDYYDYVSCKNAVNDFRAKYGITDPILNPTDRKKRPHWIKTKQISLPKPGTMRNVTAL